MVVYGDTIHQNDGHHLHRRIDTDLNEQHISWFDCVVTHTHRLYLPPRYNVGKRFISMLAGLIRGVIFAACILRKNQGTFKAAKIKQRITQRLDL